MRLNNWACGVRNTAGADLGQRFADVSSNLARSTKDLKYETLGRFSQATIESPSLRPAGSWKLEAENKKSSEVV
jgi:hypothetical protein